MSEINRDRIDHMRDLSSRTVRITNSGIFFGDEEFPYAVLRDSVNVESRAGKYNLLTVTIPVAQVIVDPRTRGIDYTDGPYVPEDADPVDLNRVFECK